MSGNEPHKEFKMSQEIIKINENVLVQGQNNVYFDTLDNFKKDYNDISISDIEYNKTLNLILRNNQKIELNSDDLELLNNIFENLENICLNKITREKEDYFNSLSLDDFKELKLSELKALSSMFEQTENKDMFLTSSLGFRVNADPKAIRNIDVLIYLNTKTFRDYDNIDRAVSETDLQVIKREISLNALNLYQQKWNFESQIKNSENIADLRDLEFSFEMLDFSK